MLTLRCGIPGAPQHSLMEKMSPLRLSWYWSFSLWGHHSQTFKLQCFYHPLSLCNSWCPWSLTKSYAFYTSHMVYAGSTQVSYNLEATLVGGRVLASSRALADSPLIKCLCLPTLRFPGRCMRTRWRTPADPKAAWQVYKAKSYIPGSRL